MSLPPEVPDPEKQHFLTRFQPLGADEQIVRFVESDDWLLWGDDGRPQLQSVGIPARDLKGQGRAVSVTTLGGVNRDFLSWRATARNKQSEWRDDPVYAFATVGTLIDIVDTKGRPELNVYADPDSDWLGVNENHASIVREPANIARLADRKTRDEVLTWGRLRLKIADAFSKIVHCSGSDVHRLERE